MEEILLHIIYLRSGQMLLTRKQYCDWQEIQDEFEDYLTSLGPWPASVVLDFLTFEYPTDMTTVEVGRIDEWLQADRDCLVLFTVRCEGHCE